MNNQKKYLKILVVGLGPIGSIFSAHLATCSCEVYGIDIWQEHVTRIREDGIVIQGFETLNSRLAGVYSNISELPEINFDYVVTSVKTPAMPKVISEIIKLGEQFQIVSLQNGIDTEEFLTEYFPRERVMRICVNYAGNMSSAGVIKMTWFNKPNYLGCLCGEKNCQFSMELSSALSAAQLDTDSVENVKYYTWKKTILNAGLMPISAITGMTMAEVMEHEETLNLVRLLLDECIAVAKAYGLDYGEGFFQECISYLSKGGHHKPSMLIDLEQGNSTEIDFINGKFVFFGKKFNIPVPVNTTVTALVKAIEETRKKQKLCGVS